MKRAPLRNQYFPLRAKIRSVTLESGGG